MAEEITGKEKEEKNQSETEGLGMESGTCTMSRKEKRKALKKMKRKQIRKDMAVKEREEEEVKLNDPQEQMKIELMEREEAERAERERKEFEEREKAWLEAMELRKKKMIEEEEEEERRRKAFDEELRRQQAENATNGDEDDDWEYVEEGPAEIIWQGNEIIVKKKKVRVPKKSKDQQSRNEDADRPTSNPLPPQSEAFADYKNGLVSAQHAIENVAQQLPNFGTEQDKAHCPFHLKTGACRFGQRCSRVHFYPDKACTILIKNMYNGPGLAWEQDEGLEYTDEEIERSYEEFYEDVHTEFLKFGEIVNFKGNESNLYQVCRNGSFHLRGNVYIQYKCLDSAVLAYHSINGRYFAGKQVICEFVNLTRWKVAICGEYMKSRFKTCSHGTACNFIHCFRNPGGDYEWADGDKPPPKYWVQRMVALFGYSEDSVYDREKSQENFGKMSAAEAGRYRSRRSRSREMDSTNYGTSRRRNDNENYVRSNRQSCKSDYKEQNKNDGLCKQSMNSKDDHYRKRKNHDMDIDGEMFDNVRDTDRDEYHVCARNSSRWQGRNSKNRSFETDSDGGWSDVDEVRDRNRDHARQSPKYSRIARYLDDYGEHENRNDEVDSHSDEGRGESYHDRTRKSSRRCRKVEYPASYGDKANRDHGAEGGWSRMDSDDDAHRRRSKRTRDDDADRHHSKRRKSSVQSSKVSKFSDEHGDSKDRILGTDFGDDWLDKSTERHHSHTRGFPKEGSDISEDQVEPTRRIKAERRHMSVEISKADPSNENFRSDWSCEPSSSDQYDMRDSPHDLDFRHNSEVKFDKQDRWESEQCAGDVYSKSRGKFTSFNGSVHYSGRERSYDCDSERYHHDKLDLEDRWNSEEVASKKSSNLDSSSKRSSKIDRARRSKSRSQSGHNRCSDNEGDSSQDNKDSEKNC
ncbi:zinc finger CCCH domain-containing protein 5 [Ziziphus jujuba]|uniref:Zinc finger CCCH domain-containing protein 5 n=1 Tax=Ziziphus jujuba TaxID=326968 RepID=A0ABM3IER7_ZIZJJ|nr:zinc finger CCCH domain-containing protein 5 [Ziziphus jujuba]